MNPSNIWRKPIYLPYLQPKLTAEIIKDAEDKIGFKFPVSLIEILKIQNGGYLRTTFKEYANELIWGIGPNYPSLLTDCWSDYKDFLSFDPHGLFPFDGDGHWYICLDFRENSKNPKITYIDTESDYQKEVATCFEEYLENLNIDVDRMQIVVEDSELNTVVGYLESQLDLKFEEPSSFNSGFPIYRSKMDDGWIWVKPNKVPWGFIRENNPDYEKLKHLMSETSQQDVEIPPSAIYVETSSEKNLETISAILQECAGTVKVYASYFKN